MDNSLISMKNTLALKTTRRLVNIKQSKTIIRPFDYMQKIFKKIWLKKYKKKRNSICTPNIYTIKYNNNIFSPMPKIKKKLECNSDIAHKMKSRKSIDNISNTSSSRIQSSSNTLLINSRTKKNSFFSMLNNDIRKEIFLSSHNLNTPISNYYVDNIIIEENHDSPQEKIRETNRISKFMKMNGYNFKKNFKNESNNNSKSISASDLEKDSEKKKLCNIKEKK